MQQINTNSDLKRQKLIDLSKRALGGIFMYPVVWFIIAYWGDVPAADQGFFVVNSVFIIVTALFRIVHTVVLRIGDNYSINFMYNSLIGLILFSAFNWGALTAWIIYGVSISVLYFPSMIIMAAFAMGGTSVLSISKLISWLFPILILAPTMIIGLFIGDIEHHVLTLLGVIAIIYVINSAQTTHKDYHEAVINHHLAVERSNQLEMISSTDQLTGLRNRLYFNRKFNENWKNCNRSRSPLSILLIDLDFFKNINDNYGHVAGDECLQLVAVNLRSVIHRTTDSITRYGGEEFVALLPNTDLENSVALANRIRKLISNVVFTFEGHVIPITCSIGVACIEPSLDDDPEQFFIAADKALYQAKEQGRNRVCVSNFASTAN